MKVYEDRALLPLLFIGSDSLVPIHIQLTASIGLDFDAGSDNVLGDFLESLGDFVSLT
jgi:hypothetical protein